MNDLLDLAKVEAGKVEVSRWSLRPRICSRALRGMLRPLLLNQSVDLVFEPVDHLPRMYSDEGKVSQILRNFISNSLKFTERGEIRVSASLDRDGDVCFSVADTGIGIAPKDLDLIFQDFGAGRITPFRSAFGEPAWGFRFRRSSPRCSAAASWWRANSEPGLHLPANPASLSRRPASPSLPRSSGFSDPASVPVLVVEDSPEMMMMYNSYLKGSGFQVLPAGTTREAEDVLDRVRPDAIVLDIVLRSEDTWAFVAKLKQDARTRNIPFVVVSTIEDQAKGYPPGRGTLSAQTD